MWPNQPPSRKAPSLPVLHNDKHKPSAQITRHLKHGHVAGLLLLLLCAVAWWGQPLLIRTDLPGAVLARARHLTTEQLLGRLSTPIPLHRSVPAAAASRWMHEDPTIGACQDGRPVLEGMSRDACTPVHCMYSPRLNARVDMLFSPLTIINASFPFAAKLTCHNPKAGQVARPAPDGPQLAIIITVHNSALLAAQCILEIYLSLNEVESADIVVVDDASTEDMGVLAETIMRLRLMFSASILHFVHRKPLGYGAANDRGIKATNATYVMLLNSDAFVLKGSVFAMVETFRNNVNAGLVGPLFVGPDNIVMEAGGLVFSDGQPANYARGRQVSETLHFKRPADYISAAAVMFPKALYTEVGGFDPIFGLGYFEDTDLAMTMWHHGRDVVYQPVAVVYHKEGSTLGGDDSPQKQALMAANKAKFLTKWHDKFKLMCPPTSSHDIAAARQLSPRVLWVDMIVPETDRDSGSIRTAQIVKALLENGYYVAYQPVDAGRDRHYEQQARFLGVHLLPVTPPNFWQLSQGGRCRFDAIVIARRHVFEAVRETVIKACPSTPIIYDTVDLHFLREARMALSATRAAAWNFTAMTKDETISWIEHDGSDQGNIMKANRDAELALVDISRITLVVSEVEKAVIQHYRPHAKVHVVSNIHQVSHQHTHCTSRSGILFVGNFNHVPNSEAVQHLLSDVLPIAKQLLPPGATMPVHIVGANVISQELREQIQATPGVQLHGYLSEPELRLLYNSVKVVVAPLMSGAGVKGKVNQAMKYGVPIVATPIAVEAMNIVDGQSGMVGRTAQEFAEKLVKVYTDCEVWDRLSSGGIANMYQYFSYEAAYSKVVQAFTAAGVPPLHRLVRADCNR